MEVENEIRNEGRKDEKAARTNKQVTKEKEKKKIKEREIESGKERTMEIRA